MSQITVNAAGAISTLNLPTFNPSQNIDPRTGGQWIPYPDSAQPIINDTNAFKPQANKVTFTNPA
jgi:hypothetical protein